MLLFALGMAGIADAAPVRRALIVGVSDYDALPARSAGGAGPFDLEGPRNDVPRMLRAARDLGVPDAEITLLANGAGADARARAPTRAAIMGALEDLAARSGNGDQVLVYFSGHGSQSPDLDGDEDDGLDEILLPSDIGPWQDSVQMVDNAITDDEFGAAVQKIRDRGAYLWVVVDSCHSGTALRGGPLPARADIEIKGIPAAALKVPQARMQGARAPAARARPAAGSLDGGGAADGGVVAFYAAVAEEAAIAGPQQLPDGTNTPTLSLLTYAITEALASGQARTYRDLYLQVQGQYDALGRLAPQPAFDGEFERVLFGHERVPPRRWGVRREGAGLLAEGGQLDGLHEGTLLAIRDARQPTGAPLAYAKVAQAGPSSATLVGAAHAGAAAAAAEGLYPGLAYLAETVAPGVPFAVRVGRPADGDAAPVAAQLRDALARLEADAAAQDAALVFVPAGQPADVYLRAGPDRVWLADQAEGFDRTGRQQPPSLDVAPGSDAGALAQALRGRLVAFARGQRLLGVMRALETQAPASLSTSVAIDRGSRRPEGQACAGVARLPPAGARTLDQATAEDGGVLKLRHCDTVYVTVENTGQVTLDMTPLYFDRDFGISYLENGQLDGIRLRPGQSRTYIAPIQTADVASGRRMPLGLEQLVVIAVPQASDQARPASYAYLAQAGASPPSRAAGEATPLDRVLDQAGFGEGAARSASVGQQGGAGALRFGWMVAAD
ncbi:caspase family protein [Pseudoxanthomonas sp. 10H]|uniref:caspase family protein n=1 Tax=Pseudoxanthomonas sp. 10H TaxID=3242729 RepID=UPI0035589B46